MRIIHLTDIHIRTNKQNIILDRVDELCKAMCADITHKEAIIIVVSGDIAFSGKADEYNIADTFFSKIKEYINEKYANNSLHILVIPGNHDCDFSSKKEVRETLLNSLSVNNELPEEIFDEIIGCQTNFFQFANNYTDLNKHKLCTPIEIKVENGKILFLLFNSSWMSVLHEQPGRLFMPMHYCNIPDLSADYNCVISVMHHPNNWLNPTNYTDFTNMLRNNVDLHLMGHEHRQDIVLSQGVDWNLNEFRGEALQGDDPNIDCAFTIYNFDDTYQNFKHILYKWDKNMFKRFAEHNSMLVKHNNGISLKIKPSDYFMNQMEDPGVNINHFSKDDIKLSDIYCWPSINLLTSESGYVDSATKNIQKNIFNELNNNNLSFVIGDSLFGKSALAKKLFIEYTLSNKCCVICNGEHLDTSDKDKLYDTIDNIFVEEYSEDLLESFRQLEPTDRVLIIDDFDKTQFNDNIKLKRLSLLMNRFSTIIMFFSSLIGLQTIMLPQINKMENIKYNIYELRLLGNIKRRELVEKWYNLGSNNKTHDEISEQIDTTCKKIDSILGEYGGILPATPLYLINIIQNIDSGAEFTFSGSQYGFLYESLIHQSLSTISKQYKNAGEINIDISVLAYLAFNMLKDKTTVFSNQQLEQTVEHFKEAKMINMSAQYLSKKMLEAKLLKEIGKNTYQFRYPYIFYYFAGRYIAYNLEQREVQDQIEYMSTNLDKDLYGNIIIFVCHFSNNKDIIDSILLAAYDNSMIMTHLNFPNILSCLVNLEK